MAEKLFGSRFLWSSLASVCSVAMVGCGGSSDGNTSLVESITQTYAGQSTQTGNVGAAFFCSKAVSGLYPGVSSGKPNFSACNGSGNVAAPTQGTVNASTVANVAPTFSTFFPVCTPKSLARSIAPSTRELALPMLKRALLMRLANMEPMQLAALSSSSSSAPPDSLGSCGGRLTYPAYSQVNGVTTATMSYQSYCSSDSSTGQKTIENGSISYVQTQVQVGGSPATSSTTASSPGGISYVVQSASGSTLTSELIAFTNFAYSVGVPGGTPTAAKPDTFGFGELDITNQLTGVTTREVGLNLVSYPTASGGMLYTISWKLYGPSGNYVNVTTSTPITTDSSGNYLTGTLVFAGANGSSATATMVPGSTMQWTLSINGTPVTTAPACQ